MTPLLAHRESVKKSRSEVAKDLKIDYAHLYRIELGENRPSPELASRLSKYFGGKITRDQILFPEEYKPVKRSRAPKTAPQEAA